MDFAPTPRGADYIKRVRHFLDTEISPIEEDYHRELQAQANPWVVLPIIDELKAIGCDTAKSVLDLTAADLVKRTDLEEETVKEILEILRSEFE